MSNEGEASEDFVARYLCEASAEELLVLDGLAELDRNTVAV